MAPAGHRRDPGGQALDPSSKLAAARWVGRKAWIDGLPETADDACYRAKDWLHQVRDAVEKEIFSQIADLLNLKVDLLFFDTTSTYFETGEADEPVARDERGEPATSGSTADEGGFRTWGKSKDHRDDLPQIVIGMAVTRSGIPVRIWCWPGNTGLDATTAPPAGSPGMIPLAPITRWPDGDASTATSMPTRRQGGARRAVRAAAHGPSSLPRPDAGTARPGS